MLAKKLNSPLTSSMGRLFDAVASLVNLRQQIRFEGQAAMELEFALDGIETDEAYSLPLCKHRHIVDSIDSFLDWSPMIEAILADVKAGVAVGMISAKFHNALAEAIVAVAKRVGQNARRAFRRLFSEPLSDRARGAAVAGGRFPAVLASARAAERRRHCLGTSHCRTAHKRLD